jgi:hypothetical protein
MTIKTAACVAITAGCLAAFAIPGAQAQSSYGSAYGPQTAPLSQSHYGPPYAREFDPHAANINEEYREGYPQGTNNSLGSAGTYGSTTGAYGTAPSEGGTEVVTNGPQGAPPPDWSARQNVRESERYTRLLEHSRAFREARMRKECGPITDPQLHQNYIASFAEYSPWAGSAQAYGSSTTGNYQSNYGR